MKVINRTLLAKRRNREFDMRFRGLSASGGIFQKASSLIAGGLVDGDYLEFGVFRGAGLAAAYKTLKHAFVNQAGNLNTASVEVMAREEIWNRFRFFGFDSFEGLPKITGVDRIGVDFRQGQFACTMEEARRNVLKTGVPGRRLELVKGWYDSVLNASTIKHRKISRAALVHIDCDLYHSTKAVLSFVKDLLVDGTILVFDDWFCFNGNPDLGEQRAFSEFRAEMPNWNVCEFQKDAAFRNSFILTRKISQ